MHCQKIQNRGRTSQWGLDDANMSVAENRKSHFLLMLRALLGWLGAFTFSFLQASGWGNSYCRELWETRRDELFTALKVTHTTGAHISLAKACHVITPIIRIWRSAITPDTWENKWGYLADSNNGTTIYPLVTKYSVHCLLLHAEPIHSLPKESTDAFNTFLAARKAGSLGDVRRFLHWRKVCSGLCIRFECISSWHMENLFFSLCHPPFTTAIKAGTGTLWLSAFPFTQGRMREMQ